jgi:hypothetical protein
MPITTVQPPGKDRSGHASRIRTLALLRQAVLQQPGKLRGSEHAARDQSSDYPFAARTFPPPTMRDGGGAPSFLCGGRTRVSYNSCERVIWAADAAVDWVRRYPRR